MTPARLEFERLFRDLGLSTSDAAWLVFLALEALEINLVFLRNVKPFKGQEDLATDCISMTEETITAIKEALSSPNGEAQPEQDGNVCARCGGIVFDPVLAQPEQEPVAWDCFEEIGDERYKVVPAHESMFWQFAVVAGDGKQQLYLGREVECANMAAKFKGAFLDGAFLYKEMLSTTPPQPKEPEQEPVAWGFQNSAITGSNRWMMLREEIPANDQYGGALWTPLYTTAPQRTWVGLTEEERGKVYADWRWSEGRTSNLALCEAIEAKLKEKNT